VAISRHDTVVDAEGFKDVMTQAINGFASHPWIATQVNEYLRTAMEAPENIHNPDWSRMWEKTQEP
jgi:hypothetical protein